MTRDGRGATGQGTACAAQPSPAGMPQAHLRIALIRHAPTPGNLEGRYIGATDEALSGQGRELALRARAGLEALRPKLLLTSGMRRCDETAQILFPGLRPIHAPGLAEMRFGAFEGKTFRELSQDARYQAWLDAYCTTPCPGGEGQEGFVRRVREALEDALDACAARLGGPRTNSGAGSASEVGTHMAQAAPADQARADVVFLVHAGTIMAAMSSLAQEPKAYWDWKASYCAGYAADALHTENGWRLETVREVAGAVE